MLIDTIKDSLLTVNTDANRKHWANHIKNNHIELSSLIGLIEAEHPVAMRFSWLLGDLCERSPEIVSPMVTLLFNKRHQVTIPHFNRSLAKFFYYCGIPEEIAGEAMDELFTWLLDVNSNVSTKHYSMLALYQLALKHPDIQPELKAAIQHQLTLNTATFEKLARKILFKLGSI